MCLVHGNGTNLRKLRSFGSSEIWQLVCGRHRYQDCHFLDALCYIRKGSPDNIHKRWESL